MSAVADEARWLLPAEAYWSPAWFDDEQERLFARVWNFVGVLDDLRDGPVQVQLAGRSVRLALDDDGRPVSADAAVDTWAGLVFAHLGGASAPPLDEWLDGVPDHIGGFRPDRLVQVARHRFELDADWKLFVENHVDVYHLWYLHDASLGAYDHTRAEWGSRGPHWVFYEPPRAGVDVHDESFWRGLLPISHVGDDRWGSGAHLVFPNLTFATGAGFFMTYQCVPVGPGRCAVDMRVRAEAGSDGAAMLELSRRIIEVEDGAACVAMQAAVRSPAFGVGPLARTHELPITRFHQAVLDLVAPAEVDAPDDEPAAVAR